MDIGMQHQAACLHDMLAVSMLALLLLLFVKVRFGWLAGMCRMLLLYLMMMPKPCNLQAAACLAKRARSLRGIPPCSMLSRFLQLVVMH